MRIIDRRIYLIGIDRYRVAGQTTSSRSFDNGPHRGLYTNHLVSINESPNFGFRPEVADGWLQFLSVLKYLPLAESNTAVQNIYPFRWKIFVEDSESSKIRGFGSRHDSG